MRAYENSVRSSWPEHLMNAGLLFIGALSIIGLVTAADGSDGQVTATGDAEAGKLLFSDDFSSTKSGWDWSDSAAAYINGSYILYVFSPNYGTYYLNPQINQSDFVVEVEATKKSGPNDSILGLLVRRVGPEDYSGPDSFYAFLISCDGYYDIEECNNGDWVTSQKWIKSEAIRTGSQTNLLKVVAQGDKLSFYVNGEKLNDLVDDTLASGNFGLYAESQSEGNLVIAYDSFKVWSIKE
jgi:hypothetical protein